MANFTLDQTGQEIQDILDTVGNNQATQGQVLTADGSGGASWGNVPAPSGVVTLDDTTQTFEDHKRLLFQLGSSLYLQQDNSNQNYIRLTASNGEIFIYNTSYYYATYKATAIIYNGRILEFPTKAGTFALTSDITAKVPDAPTTDGTYTLKCVVSNSGATKTYQWVLDN